MLAIGDEHAPRLWFPDLHGVVFTTGSNEASIGRPDKALHGFAMTAIGEVCMAIRAIPDVYSAVPACRSYPAAIRRPRQRQHIIAMTAINNGGSPLSQTPSWNDMDLLFPRPCTDPFS